MSIEQNKQLISFFNKEVVEKGNVEQFKTIASVKFVNHSALEGMDPGREGMMYFLGQLLPNAFHPLQVKILDMVAEGNKVTTRKKMMGVHNGDLMGIAATGKHVEISIIDIFTIEQNLLTAHWAETNFASVIQSLAS